MAENNWLLNDSIPGGFAQEFSAPQAENAWALYDSWQYFGAFETAAAPWTLHDWLACLGYQMAGGASAFFGILKRWTGVAWAKALLKTYLGGTFQAKPMKRWDGSEWKEIDTTGV